MAVVSFAEATWSGDLENGSGMITYLSSGAVTRLPVSWAARTVAHDGKTSPEELLAAAHASCFSMALSSRLGKNGTPPQQMDVRVDVTFDKGEAGWKVTKSAITARVKADGLDASKLKELAEDAKEKCPISQAIKGNVELSVDAALA
jgi:osmotically inducible protein OsmC